MIKITSPFNGNRVEDVTQDDFRCSGVVFLLFFFFLSFSNLNNDLQLHLNVEILLLIHEGEFSTIK